MRQFITILLCSVFLFGYTESAKSASTETLKSNSSQSQTELIVQLLQKLKSAKSEYESIEIQKSLAKFGNASLPAIADEIKHTSDITFKIHLSELLTRIGTPESKMLLSNIKDEGMGQSEVYAGDPRCKATWMKLIAAANTKNKDRMADCFFYPQSYTTASLISNLSASEFEALSKMKYIKFVKDTGVVKEYLALDNDEQNPHTLNVYYSEDQYGNCKINPTTRLTVSP